jgi:hypothetical protein
LNWLKKWFQKPLTNEPPPEILANIVISGYQEEVATLDREIKERDQKIKELEKEVCHWKSIALNFRKFHQ